MRKIFFETGGVGLLLTEGLHTNPTGNTLTVTGAVGLSRKARHAHLFTWPSHDFQSTYPIVMSVRPQVIDCISAFAPLCSKLQLCNDRKDTQMNYACLYQPISQAQRTERRTERLGKRQMGTESDRVVQSDHLVEVL